LEPGTRKGSTARPAPSRVEKDRGLFERAEDPADPMDRSSVIEHFLPLARAVAAQNAHPDVPFEDIFQTACVALIKAVDRYELGRGKAFSSFAVPTIAGEIKRYYRDRTWSVRPPRGLQELLQRVEREIERARAREGRSPSVGEIAERLEVSDEEVLEALHARRARNATSLDAPLGDDDDRAVSLAERTGTEDPAFDHAETRLDLDDVLRMLTQREQTALHLRFQRGLSQEQIGREIGVSQMQVSRILRDALQRAHVILAGRASPRSSPEETYLEA
jgi:RNA polymerase sigma-B factor